MKCIMVACVLAGALVRPLAAQSDSLLREAVRLVTEGRGDSARALVRARINAVPPSDSLYPEALYAAGLVAAQSDSALIYFRRVSLDFSQSAWADQALLRLAQLAFAGGDFASAQRSTERILNDYPLSDVRGHAAYWAGRVQLELGNLALACRHLAAARDQAGDDVELGNQASFYMQRCSGVTVAPPPADSAAPPARPATRVYAVQVAAVRSAAAADEVMRQLQAEGYRARVVRDADGLLKVRVGQFTARAEADRVARDLKGRLGGQPFVVEEQ